MWVKICGIRDIVTAEAVAELGPQAIGLNFYRSSPRFVAPATAKEIAGRLPPEVTPVGLFVNHTPDEIRAICGQCGLETIQLHGDEPADILAELREFRVIRAFRCGPEGLAPLGEYLDRCRELDALPVACLIDAHVAGMYGGSGETVPWDRLAEEYPQAEWPPLILAGGLTPRNVAAAIQTVRPWGVDVASGVESTRAVKDLALVREFIRESRRVAGE